MIKLYVLIHRWGVFDNYEVLYTAEMLFNDNDYSRVILEDVVSFLVRVPDQEEKNYWF